MPIHSGLLINFKFGIESITNNTFHMILFFGVFIYLKKIKELTIFRVYNLSSCKGRDRYGILLILIDK